MTDTIPTIWFVAISLLWFGFLFLDGFDLGVGMRIMFGTKNESERQTLLRSIGPFWDGNEVWLVTAVGAMFAAFPFWYASLLSGSYLLCLVIIIGLIGRVIGIEYYNKVEHSTSRYWCRVAIGLGSLIVAFGIGGLLGITTIGGLPIDGNGDSYASFGWLTPGFALGGLAVVGVSLVHGAAFSALKTTKTVKTQSHKFIARWGIVLLIPLIAWVALAASVYNPAVPFYYFALPLILLLPVIFIANLKQHDGLVFSLVGVFLLYSLATIFAAIYPVVLPSSLEAAYSLTIGNASSSEYTLGIMTIVTLIGLPVIILYQLWTYWVFRKRVANIDIPIVAALAKKPHHDNKR